MQKENYIKLSYYIYHLLLLHIFITKVDLNGLMTLTVGEQKIFKIGLKYFEINVDFV